MIYTKSIEVDIAHQYLNDVIRLHEGDAAGAQLQITLFDNGEAFNVAAFTVKYDAVIAGYLAENGASATVSGNVITVPITANMCAKSGTLEIDVKIIEGSGSNAKTFFLQKFEAQVQRRVVNEDVIIDVSGTTIGEHIAALEAKFPVATADIADAAVTPAKLDRTYFERTSIATADVDSATENGIAYRVSIDGRSNLLFCVNSGTNLRAQFRFDTLGYAKYRTQAKFGDEWQAWSDWKELASNINIADGAVTAAKIATGAVTSDKLGSSSVITSKIDSGAVTTGKIDGAAVTTAKIADGAVTTEKIADDAVTADEIADNAVTSGKIADEAVTTAKVADAAITRAKIGYADYENVASDPVDGYYSTVGIAGYKGKIVRSTASGRFFICRDEAGSSTNPYLYWQPIPKVAQVWDAATSAQYNNVVPSTYAGQLGDEIIMTPASGTGGAIWKLEKIVTNYGTTSYYWTQLADAATVKALSDTVGDANDLLEAALNYQS